MEEKYEITDAELEIMQVLWKNKECNLAEIIEKLSINEEKNKNTIKTLIHRLTIKGAIESKKINSREVIYIPKVSEKKYIKKESNIFLDKVFSGNINKLLLNFVEDKKVSKEELQKLIDIMEDKEN